MWSSTGSGALLRQKFQLFGAMLLAATLLFGTTRSAQAEGEKKSVRVGVILDGPSERDRQTLEALIKEVKSVTKREFNVQFLKKDQKELDWTKASIGKALDEFLANDEIDIIIAHGVIGSQVAFAREEYEKPVFAPFVLDDPSLKDRDGALKRKKNLSYSVWSLDLRGDIRRFLLLGDYKKIALVFNKHISEETPQAVTQTLNQFGDLKSRVTPVPAGHTAESILKALPADTDAVYLAPNDQLASGEMKKVAEALIEKKLPSFAWFGSIDVPLGILAGIGNDEDITRLSRRLALNIQSVILGGAPERAVSAFQRSETLVFNAVTARTIGVWPDWIVLDDAQIIGDTKAKIDRKLSLAQAVKAALKSNRDLGVNRYMVESGKADVKRARSALLPQLGASIGASWIDADRAGFGNAERTLQWGANLNQTIYNERAWAGFTSQKHLQRSREKDYASAELNLIHQASVAYLQLLQAKTLESIRRENLKLSRENLSIAKVRKRIGVAGPGEVHRWEAQIATARGDVIRAAAQRNQAEIAVNRLLARPLEEEFATEETDITQIGLSQEHRFAEYLSNPLKFKVLRDFFAKEALERSPELKSIDATRDAVARRKKAAKRAYYIPTVEASASITHRFLQGGAGTEELTLPPGIDLSGFPNPDNLDLFVGVTASIPLFQSGARTAELDQSNQELGRLSMLDSAQKLAIEQRIRAALHSTGAAFADIKLSRSAADAAGSNLELVMDAYAQGRTPVVDLLNAQNNALVAQLAAANASLQFLVELMNVERALGRFTFFIKERERQQIFDRLDTYLKTKKNSVR